MPLRSYPNYEYRPFRNFEFRRSPIAPRSNGNVKVVLSLAAVIGLSRVFSVLYKQLDALPFWRRRYERRLLEKEAVEFLFDGCGAANFSILSHYSAF